jgi:hypothetical protein
MGSSSLRKANFFERWYRSVTTNCTPEKIVIVDSASPVKPWDTPIKGIHLISLDHNPGHATHINGRHAGVTYSMTLGMMYALLEDVDYWVYVEQDALLHGRGIIEHAISHMHHDIMFGSGVGTPQPMQQSLMIIKREAIAQFIQKLFRIRLDDSTVSPEMKFAIAASPLLSRLPNAFYGLLTRDTTIGHFARIFVSRVSQSRFSGFSVLPFGYGRTRPINYDDKYFYFQHGDENELSQHDALSKVQ